VGHQIDRPNLPEFRHSRVSLERDVFNGVAEVDKASVITGNKTSPTAAKRQNPIFVPHCSLQHSTEVSSLICNFKELQMRGFPAQACQAVMTRPNRSLVKSHSQHSKNQHAGVFLESRTFSCQCNVYVHTDKYSRERKFSTDSGTTTPLKTHSNISFPRRENSSLGLTRATMLRL
jgi:hypothetical protein